MFFERHLRHIKESETDEWIILRIFLALGVALFSILPSVFLLELGLEESSIGLYFSLISLVAIIISLFFTYPLEKINQLKIFSFVLFLSILVYFSMALWKTIFMFLFLFTILKVLEKVRLGVENIQFRDVTPPEDFIKKKGILYAILNVAWIIMPILGGLLLLKYSFDILFYTTGALFLVSLILSFYFRPHNHMKTREEYDKNVFKNIKFYISKKDLILAFFLSFGTRFWYIFIFVFVPIYLIKQGFSLEYVGYAIGATQLPLVLVQLKTSLFVKKLGFKVIFMSVFFTLFLICIGLFFTQQIGLILLLLFISGFFVAFLEVLPEVYYFKHVTSLQEEKTYFIFSNGDSFGMIFGNLLMGGSLLFLSINQLFLFVSLVMFLFFILSFYVTNYKS